MRAAAGMGSGCGPVRARRCWAGGARPWRGLLELRAEAHQQVLAAEVGHQLDATGKPSSGHPSGSDSAGWPVTLNGRVNALRPAS